MLSAGTLVGPYELVEPLGSGGFGMVWRARSDARPDAAVKILHKDLLYDESQAMAGPSVVERFLAEARIIQQLDHPGLVQIYDVIESPEQKIMAYAMERLKGFDLTQLSDDLDLETVLDLYGEIADTLAFLHANGVIHRDVKPQNVFICEPTPGAAQLCRVKLLDFGAAKELHAHSQISQTGTGVLVGTVRSMAPESFRDVQVTPAVDQWGLGVSLYESLTGRHPFEGPVMMAIIIKIETAEPPPLELKPSFGLKSVPPVLESVVTRAIAKRPEDRFPSIHDMAKALRAAAAELRPRHRSNENDETLYNTYGVGGQTPSLLPPSVRLLHAVMHKATENPATTATDRDTDVEAPASSGAVPLDAHTPQAPTPPEGFAGLEELPTEAEDVYFPSYRPPNEPGFTDDTTTTRTNTPLPRPDLGLRPGEVTAPPLLVDGARIREAQDGYLNAITPDPAVPRTAAPPSKEPESVPADQAITADPVPPSPNLALADLGGLTTPTPDTADSIPAESPTEPGRVHQNRTALVWLGIGLATLAIGVGLGWLLKGGS